MEKNIPQWAVEEPKQTPDPERLMELRAWLETEQSNHSRPDLELSGDWWLIPDVREQARKTAQEEQCRLRQEEERIRQAAEKARKEREKAAAKEAEEAWQQEMDRSIRLRQEQEEAERQRREAEEAERRRREAEEAERQRREAEEAERQRREAEEAERQRREAEEAERLRLEVEEAERQRLEAEMAEQLRRDAEETERLRREAEEQWRRYCSPLRKERYAYLQALCRQQERIAQENRGLLGESARRRKAARIRLEELKLILEREFPVGPPEGEI